VSPMLRRDISRKRSSSRSRRKQETDEVGPVGGSAGAFLAVLKVEDEQHGEGAASASARAGPRAERSPRPTTARANFYRGVRGTGGSRHRGGRRRAGGFRARNSATRTTSSARWPVSPPLRAAMIGSAMPYACASRAQRARSVRVARCGCGRNRSRIPDAAAQEVGAHPGRPTSLRQPTGRRAGARAFSTFLDHTSPSPQEAARYYTESTAALLGAARARSLRALPHSRRGSMIPHCWWHFIFVNKRRRFGSRHRSSTSKLASAARRGDVVVFTSRSTRGTTSSAWSGCPGHIEIRDNSSSQRVQQKRQSVGEYRYRASEYTTPTSRSRRRVHRGPDGVRHPVLQRKDPGSPQHSLRRRSWPPLMCDNRETRRQPRRGRHRPVLQLREGRASIIWISFGGRPASASSASSRGAPTSTHLRILEAQKRARYIAECGEPRGVTL